MKKYTSGAFESTTYSIYTRSSEEIITEFPAIITTTSQNTIAIIKGNMVQTGTPSPSSIIMPDECGDKTANLCSGTANINKTVNSVTITSDALGNFTVTGVADSGGGRTQKISDNISLSAGSYRVSLGRATTAQLCVSKASDNTFITGFYNSGSFTINSDTTVYFGLNFISGNSYNDTFTIMLQPFSTDYPYEPYGYKIPILSGGTTTNVYLGEVQSERKVYKYTFTGQETSWRITGTGRLAVEIPFDGILGQYCICSHYKGTNVTSLESLTNGDCEVGTLNNSNNQEFVVYDTNYTSTADFKTYLQQQYAADTPVTVWYVLATPQTTTLNEPIRKIGNYADSVSVTGIPTTAEEQFDIDTTLKPSEVDLLVYEWTESQDKIYPWGETNAKVLRRKKSAKSKT